ncbi:MAG: hypothetical protein HKL88_04040 [Bacteroidia bacterium]|jgi:hypothetical protein|nr:hypothetical protein [Bacteroidia bacterium]
MKNAGNGCLTVRFLIASMLLYFAACKPSSEKTAQELIGQNVGAGSGDSAEIHSRTKKMRSVFYTMPSALEVTQLLKESGAKYSVNYPSDPQNLDKYTSTKGQAINLGIYASDLSYAGIYNQKEDAMLYLKCAGKLSAELGIPDAFDKGTIARIESNMGNEDSLLDIITTAYWNTDSYLKNNDRQQVSALIVAGGWVEGLFIAIQMANHSNNNQALINRVAEQKLSLDNLVGLISTYPADEALKSTLAQLKKIQDAYAGVTIEESKTEVSTDGATNTTTIKGNETVRLTPEQMKNLTAVTDSVRTHFTLIY